MKWIIIFAIFIITLVTTPSMVFAQPMMGSTGSPQVGTQSVVSSDGHTASEEAEGKAIWEKLQAKQVECKNLTNDNFESLGEYFMGQMAGGSHEAMNNMMISMMGEEGEEQIHIAMGKRLSGCESNAQVPTSGIGFMPMMWMMGGWGSASWLIGIFGWLSLILFWLLVILGVVTLVRYLAKSGSSKEDKTPLDILKEHYARGEINKKEFEEKKKDLI